MEKPLQPRLDLEQVSPEVLSYVYQSLMEFEPYTTDTTEMAVIAKDPLKLLNGSEGDSLPPRQQLKKMYRISISLADQGTKIEAEALDTDIYRAIKGAKDKLLKELEQIHDSVVSSSERNLQIQSALSGNTVH